MAHGQKTGGRAKGTPNKVTAELREMILNALAAAGGENYFLQQARDTPSAFLALIGKILPSEVKAQHSGPGGAPIAFSDLERANRLRYLIEKAKQRAANTGDEGS